MFLEPPNATALRLALGERCDAAKGVLRLLCLFSAAGNPCVRTHGDWIASSLRIAICRWRLHRDLPAISIQATAAALIRVACGAHRPMPHAQLTRAAECSRSRGRMITAHNSAVASGDGVVEQGRSRWFRGAGPAARDDERAQAEERALFSGVIVDGVFFPCDDTVCSPHISTPVPTSGAMEAADGAMAPLLFHPWRASPSWQLRGAQLPRQ